MKQFEMSDPNHSNEYNGMTHFVDLPTKGLFYSKEHPLYGQETIEIKMLTTKEEEVLGNPSYIEKGVVLEKFLESIIINKNVNHQMLHDSDQMAILLASRIEAYDKDYPVVIECAECDEEFNVDVDILEMSKNVVQDDMETTGAGTSIIELPKSKKVVEFKVLLPYEVKSIETTVERMKKTGIKTSFTNEFYQRVIVSIDGEVDGEKASAFVKNMFLKDSRAFRSAYENSIPKISTEFESACSHCEHVQKGGLPIQASFFFPNL
tara:strand:+ start:2221 stop:3012 length:792 start_codon:yes stop_codon:yes gene_type:complete